VKWIDVHTHLNMLDTSPELALGEAKALGVGNVITIGTGPDDWPLVREFGRKYFPQVACTLGVHPHDAKIWTLEAKQLLEEGIKDPAVVAVGEIGLDYFYKNSQPEEQLKAFREQMAIAEQAGLPVEIHTREAEADTIMVLKEFAGRVIGLLHCFTSSWTLAEEALKLGYHISFSGVLTFKNAEELRETCRRVPLDRLHVETDAPFLAPVPHRGKKNRPAFVIHTAEKVAELHGITLEELSEATSANARRLFHRWQLA
jgi:TatD DNase family protein